MKLKFDKSCYLDMGMQPLAGTSFVNWVKLLMENRFRVDWQFIPKALYVTLMVTAMTPIRIYEKIKFDKKLENIKITPPLFIVGHFRGGTTFLHYLMVQDKDLAFVSTMEANAP
ncbi:MAG: sulfotransferase, partial [Planctomycetes bacterium]|nr:sulfotransferase [Planctomycetota bacterium]